MLSVLLLLVWQPHTLESSTKLGMITCEHPHTEFSLTLVFLDKLIVKYHGGQNETNSD